MDVQHDPQGFNRLFVIAREFDAEFEVWGSYPVQGLGMVLGRDLYFRARDMAWSFDVANSEGHFPSDGYQGSDGFYREREYPNADCMPLPVAVNVIVKCLEEYTGVRAERGSTSGRQD